MTKTAPSGNLTCMLEAAARELCVTEGVVDDYELMVDQQSMLVQYHKEVQQQQTKMNNCANWVESSSSSGITPTTTAPTSTPATNVNGLPLKSLNDLTVAELKAECKKRSLVVGGPKPNLIARLQSFEEEIIVERRGSIPVSETLETRRLSETSTEHAEAPPEHLIRQYLAKQGHSAQPAACTPLSACGGSDTSGIGSEYGSPLDTRQPGARFPQRLVAVPSTVPSTVPQSVPQSVPTVQLNGTTVMQLMPQPPAVSSVCAQNTSEMLSALPIDDGLPSTISLHEKMLQHQQEKIDILQSELNRAQQQLKHQQRTILAARRDQQRQAEEGVDETTADATTPHSIDDRKQNAAAQWLSMIDTQQLQKFHIQLFLHFKLQQQQMQSHVTAASDMAELNAQLRDELVIQQCTAEIVHTIKSQPHIVVRICQLMRRLNQGLIHVIQPATQFVNQPSTQQNFMMSPPQPVVSQTMMASSESMMTTSETGMYTSVMPCHSEESPTETSRKRGLSPPSSECKRGRSPDAMQAVFAAVLQRVSDMEGIAHSSPANSHADEEIDNLLQTLRQQSSDVWSPSDKSESSPTEEEMLNDLMSAGLASSPPSFSSSLCTTPPAFGQTAGACDWLDLIASEPSSVIGASSTTRNPVMPHSTNACLPF